MINVKRILVDNLVLIFIFCLALSSSLIADQGWSTYKGAWFEVKYPSTFKVIPSIKGQTSTAGYDSAFFVSPDKKVEFYIFSPQWNGEPTDIAITVNETLVAEKTIINKKTRAETRAYTIKAKNNSYSRSYNDVRNKEYNTRQVIGLKYQGQKSYQQYKADYLKFKSSIIMFGD